MSDLPFVIPHLNLFVESYPRKIRVEFYRGWKYKCSSDAISHPFCGDENKSAQMGVFTGG